MKFVSSKASAGILGLAISLFAFGTSALAAASSSSSNAVAVQDKGQVPLCVNGIVHKYGLFLQMAQHASPQMSYQLVTQVNWRKIITSKNVCSAAETCNSTDNAAIASTKQQYDLILGFGEFAPSNPSLSAEQYFQGDDGVNPIKCLVSNPTPPAPAAPSSPLDAKSSIRVRGVSDDLWIAQQDPTFAKSSSATVNYTQNEAVPQSSTATVTAAVGYDLLQDDSPLGALVPYVSGNVSLIDTHLKPRTNSANNFVAGGMLYTGNLYVPNSNIENQITFKAQQVDGTTMRSELTSLQAIYAPWTNAVGLFPALNSVVGFPTPDGTVPSYFGQVLFDVRSDTGYYEDRGLPQYIAQNKSYERFGSKFGYAFIGNPPGWPSFSLSVTETALYGATGGPRNISYFDTLLQLYFDPKKLFSASFEYTNGRDENTYVLSHQYKAGLSARY